MPWPRRASLVTALLAAAVTVFGALVLVLVPEQDGPKWLWFAPCAVIGAVSTALGLFVSKRRPDNPVGALLTVIGLVPPLIALIDSYQFAGLARPDLLPGTAGVHQLSSGLWTLWYQPVMLLGLLFPDGKPPPGRRWRWVLYGALLNPLFFDVLVTMDPTPYDPPFDRLSQPFPTLPGSWAFVAFVSLALMLVLLVACALSVRARYRAAGPVERTQVKWFALGAAALPGTLLLCWASYLLFGEASDLVVFGLAVLYVGVPALTTLAMLRHDLYDVDRAASAVVTYGLVSAALLAVYSTLSFTGGLALGRGSAVAAAAATALVAVGLAPLKNRLRRRVDRRLYPVRQATLAAIGELERRVHEGVTRPEQLEQVLRTSLRDPALRVGYMLPGGTGCTDTDGAPVPDGPPHVPIRLGDRPIGVLAATPGLASRELLREVSGACTLLTETVRLRLQLGQALHAVEASRTRLLRTGYRERRRLERDLHDGAQQRLVSLGMALRLAQRHLDDGSVDVDGLLDQTVAELGTAVAELRELAHGLRPSSLDDGLGPALEALALRTPLDVDCRLDGRQLPDEVVTTAYYVASEAVANAVKHAEADRIGLRAMDDDEGRLRITVEDDGRGGAVARPGTGLAGLSDRVAALGGLLRITSAPGQGTIVEAVLPCAS